MFKQANICRNMNYAVRRTQCVAGLFLLLPWVTAYCFGLQVSSPPSLVAASLQQPIAGTQNVQEIITLESAKPVQRELSGGQKHIYQLALSQGQYAAVTVEQRGIDVIVRAFGAEGKLISEFDAEIRNTGTEKVELVALTTNSYRLEVEAKLKKAAAGSYEIRVAELRPATESDRSLQEARSLYDESQRLGRSGKYGDALAVASRALAIREQVLGPEHPAVAVIVNRLGMFNYSLGNNAQAEALFNRALNIFQTQLGPDSLSVADPLNNLSTFYKSRGEFLEAETMLLRVLSIREKELGSDHTLVASALNNLGALYRKRGDNAKAEAMYERSLEIRERTLGADHPDLALTLQNLAALSYFKGDYATAQKLDRRTLEIHEKDLGKEHPRVADDLNSLALDYADGGELEKAEPLYRRALAIFENSFGRDHISSVGTLNNLGKLYQQRGDNVQAEVLYKRASQITENNLTGNELTLAICLNNLGGVLALKGDYAQAETLLTRTLAIREKILGPDHYDVGRACDSLARLYALKGNVERAVMFQERANRINERNITLNLATGSEHQKLAYMAMLSEDLNQTIALHANVAPESRDAREQAITAILQRKGRVLDVMTDSLAVLRRRFDAQDQVLVDRLNDTNARLAEIALNVPQDTTLAEHQKQLAAIQEQKEKLESEVSRRSAGFYEPSPAVTIDAVEKLIPSNAALVEFVVYQPLNPIAADSKASVDEPRYVVYILRHKGEVGWADLGAVRDLDKALDAWRQALRDPLRNDVRQLARAVDEKVMRPVRALVGDATQLLVSPDGELNLVPFAALVDEEGRYLIHHYSFTYLTSGRDLLRMQVTRQAKSKALVVANPSFGEPTAESLAVTAKTSVPRNKHGSIVSGRDLREVYFGSLSGTAQEARSIQTVFPEARLLSASQATESAVKQVNAPLILHLATHGFFLSESSAVAAGSDAQGATRSINANSRIANPLLRSGLALAGANLLHNGNDDGILTALEASGLNLWGTKLVVLSACDTGVGEVRNGEGVYGLRRAFVLAGAESLVMSLWPVSDYSTRELMTNYYKNLKQGLGRGASLRQVQLDMLGRNSKLHPFYWANFIQSGEWANLEGKR